MSTISRKPSQFCWEGKRFSFESDGEPTIGFLAEHGETTYYEAWAGGNPVALVPGEGACCGCRVCLGLAPVEGYEAKAWCVEENFDDLSGVEFLRTVYIHWIREYPELGALPELERLRRVVSRFLNSNTKRGNYRRLRRELRRLDR